MDTSINNPNAPSRLMETVSFRTAEKLYQNNFPQPDFEEGQYWFTMFTGEGLLPKGTKLYITSGDETYTIHQVGKLDVIYAYPMEKMLEFQKIGKKEIDTLFIFAPTTEDIQAQMRE